eukprot:Tbor_TRINITY_DN5149_c0_g1::TRINITY_DN5149_c0_g1_i1::g.26124::m.26124
MPCHNPADVRAKLLVRVAALLKKSGGQPCPETMEVSKRLLDQKLSRNNRSGTLSDRDIKAIVREAKKQTTNKSHKLPHPNPNSSIDNVHDEESSFNNNSRRGDSILPPMGLSVSPINIPHMSVASHEMIENTTKAQRRRLADQEAVRLMEEQQAKGLEREKQEKEHQLYLKRTQRKILDEQIEHIKKKREADRLRKEEERKEMEALIEYHNSLTQQERQAIHNRTMSTGKFCLNQMLAANEEKRNRNKKMHDDEVKFLKELEEMEKRQSEEEVKKKLDKQGEWKKVSLENDKKMKEKMLEREKEREKDREYQRMYSENEERLEKERAEMYSRIAQKQTSFQQLANEIALKSKNRDKTLDEKIKSDYANQIREYEEEERRRKMRIREEIRKCNDFQLQQIEEKQRIRAQQREEERLAIESIRQQEETYNKEQKLKEQLKKAEALKIYEQLNTQVKLSHYKETLPIETSIPRSYTVYSPEQ